MYESKTVDNINQEMLTNISDVYEKTPGNPTADIVKSFAIESNNLWLGLQALFNKLDVDLLNGDDLTQYVSQRKGIDRKVATFAKATLTVTGNGNITIGDLFSTSNGVQFKSLQNVTVVNTATVNVEALIAGNSGNVGANAINQMPVTLAGIVSCTNLVASYDGFEAETDDNLRSRYYDALRVPATSNNKFHFRLWALQVTGVGDAKILPLWNGALTVKVIIIDANKQPSSVELVKKVQDYIDPMGIDNSTWGTGAGESAIGNYCTVVSAIAKPININVDITEDTNYTLAEVIEEIKNNITAYLKEIAFKESYVSFAKLGSIILNTEGVKDYTTLLVNGAGTNISIGAEEVATMGEVVVT